tara:strand:+ start:28039 stop:28872 length:834 start_codon:yes stop_codon:yes gene_type:complete
MRISLKNQFLKIFKNSFLLNKIKELSRGNSKYIIRLDDACETMNLNKWKKLEYILDELNIKPIIAVIPRNEDHTLFIDKKNKNFWSLVKSWQKKGWHIALHGYEHKYHEINSNKQYLPLYNRSEFAGLNKKLQKEKILHGIDIFKNNNISTKIWVAPSHSFDETTINVIRESTNINIISDGIAFYPVKKNGLLFLPQQIWKPFKFPIGIWTLCLHPNNMSYLDIKKLEISLKNDFYKNKFINLNSINKYISNYNFLSFLFDKIFRIKIIIKDFLRRT